MFTSLLVALDDSKGSRAAVNQAVHIGRRFRSKIVLARMVRRQPAHASVDPAGWVPPSPGTSEGAGEQLVAEAVAQVEAANLSAEVVSTRGDPVDELHQLSTSTDAVLVGRSGQHDPVGRHTRELLWSTPIPIIVCGLEESPFDHCAVAVDGGETAMRALALAARFAGICGAKLELIHVTADPASQDEVLARAGAVLSEVPVRFDVHREPGAVQPAIADAVQRLGCNALFAGGHLSDRHLSIPSHSEAFLRTTDIPVLIHN